MEGAGDDPPRLIQLVSHDMKTQMIASGALWGTQGYGGQVGLWDSGVPGSSGWWELCRGMYAINGCPDAGCTPLHVSKPLGRRCVRPFPKGILNTDERARRYARCVVD